MFDSQTTEMNALINSCQKLFSSRDELPAMNIGTQDVNILHLADTNSYPRINTSKSCVGGTDMVQIKIPERRKQTNPDFTFETLDNLGSEAKESEVINTTWWFFGSAQSVRHIN